MATAWSYSVKVAPDCPPVSLSSVKSYLKITGAAQDSLIESLTEAATNYAEQYTKRCFINRTIRTYRDDFTGEIELRRSPLSSVSTVKYLVSDVLTEVSSATYYNTIETDFSRITSTDGEAWPTDGDTRLQAVEIIFIAGYGADERAVPEDIKLAIMQHVSAMLENRGDCTLAESLPVASREIYNKSRIMDIKI